MNIHIPNKLKPLIWTILPLLLSAIVSLLVLLKITTENLERQTADFGTAITSQLAITLTEPMVQQDILSLNVLLSELVQRQYFEFASVYAVDNRLVAQAGERKITASYRTFTTDISFQNAVAGYVEVGVSTELNDASIRQGVIYLVAANLLLITATILFWLKPLPFWLKPLPFWLKPLPLKLRLPGDHLASNMPDQTNSDDAKLNSSQLIIVIKAGPGKSANQYRDWIDRSVMLYGGELLSSHAGEYTLLFGGSNHTFDGLCCAWLLMTVCRQGPSLMVFKAGADLVDRKKLEICRKHASYLASISEGSILVSNKVLADANIQSRDDIELVKYHGSAVSDDQVYTLNALDPTLIQLIERQIVQLST